MLSCMNKGFRYIALVILLLTCYFSRVNAQAVGLRTNLIGWGAKMANIGVDLVVTERSSFEFVAYKSINGGSWDFLRNVDAYALQFGYRYWFAHQPLEGLWVGTSATPAHYELKVGDNKHKGEAFPMGANIGYTLPLTKRLNIEISWGLGAFCFVEKITDSQNNFWKRRECKFQTTNVGLSLGYIIK